MSEYDVTVIIAEELAAGNLQRVFAALDPGRRPRVEFIVCSSSPVAALPGVPELDNVWVLQAAGNARIPVLWRDGIKAASAAYVALTTCHVFHDQGQKRQTLSLALNNNLEKVYNDDMY